MCCIAACITSDQTVATACAFERPQRSATAILLAIRTFSDAKRLCKLCSSLSGAECATKRAKGTFGLLAVLNSDFLGVFVSELIWASMLANAEHLKHSKHLQTFSDFAADSSIAHPVEASKLEVCDIGV